MNEPDSVFELFRPSFRPIWLFRRDGSSSTHSSFWAAAKKAGLGDVIWDEDHDLMAEVVRFDDNGIRWEFR